MDWQTARPFCFLIDCWQFKGSLIARVVKKEPATVSRYIV
jgi:hypothetical protein